MTDDKTTKADSLDLPQLMDAYTMWVENENPSCCEIDAFIEFIENNEPDHSKEALFEEDVLCTTETGTEPLRMTKKTLAAKHFALAYKQMDSDDPELTFSVRSRPFQWNTEEVNRDRAIRMIGLLLNYLESYENGTLQNTEGS